jgi:hypothetical protein
MHIIIANACFHGVVGSKINESMLYRPSRRIWETRIEEIRVMNSVFPREGALILPFPPPGGRRPASRFGQANLKQSRPTAEVETVVSCGSWYHEAAIIESDRSRKR